MPNISVNYSKDALEQTMRNETAGKKLCLAISAAIHVGFAGIVGIILCAWWGNQKSIADEYNGAGN